jgi:diadenosine tetraphosphate (Ap4A) HIT family hydrolase
MNGCVFCEVLSDCHSKQIIKRGKLVTAIRKPYRSHKANFLIIANQHIVNLHDTAIDTGAILAEMVKMANELAAQDQEPKKDKVEGKPRDWSMRINNGKEADQTVFHLHAHIFSNEHWHNLETSEFH